MFHFKNLEAWHKAIAFADVVYELTSVFPSDEQFGLTNQMRRAAVSISSNIAEGTSPSSLDYSRFIEMATGSLFEVVSQATISKRKGFLSVADDEKMTLAAEEQSRMLSGLRNSFLARLREEEAPCGTSSPPLNSQLSTFVTPPAS